MFKNNEVKNMKDKMEGKMKEKVGEITGDEKMEMKGKIQTAKAEVKTDINKIKKSFEDKVKDIKAK